MDTFYAIDDCNPSPCATPAILAIPSLLFLATALQWSLLYRFRQSAGLPDMQNLAL